MVPSEIQVTGVCESIIRVRSSVNTQCSDSIDYVVYYSVINQTEQLVL